LSVLSPAALPDPDDEAIEHMVALGLCDVLLTAPAGCGKTEALAHRAAGLVRGGHVTSPRKILAVSFSNKARDNLRTRLRQHLRGHELARLTVANLHGAAARIVRAHGQTIGLTPSSLVLPTRGAHRRRQAQAGINWGNRDEVEGILRSAKAGDYNDEEVLARITASGNAVALRYEQALRGEGALDFDDLLRQASRILVLDEVALGYQLHFAAVLVDEVQDLSMQQLRMVQRLGADRITYAGDYGQGIFSFAGADPDGVFAEINARSPESFQLTRSFRSSPAVLCAVNALGALRGAPSLRCADTTAWTDQATFTMQTFATVEDEAAIVLEHVQPLLTSTATVGVIARVGSRLNAMRHALEPVELSFTDWSAPLHHVEALRRLHEHMTTALAANKGHDDAALDALEQLCLDSCPEDDVDGRDEVQEACAELRKMVAAGASLQKGLARCRPDEPGDAPVKPGLHLLNAHLGKGQEFDHVVIIGLEKGIVPDFRATSPEMIAEELRTLIVMVSRARKSLYLTFSATVPIASGWPKPRVPSPWWETLASAE